MDLALFLHDCQVAEIAEGLFEHRARVKVFDLFRATGAVLQLLGRVALNDQQAPGLERTFASPPISGRARPAC